MCVCIDKCTVKAENKQKANSHPEYLLPNRSCVPKPNYIVHNTVFKCAATLRLLLQQTNESESTNFAMLSLCFFFRNTTMEYYCFFPLSWLWTWRDGRRGKRDVRSLWCQNCFRNQPECVCVCVCVCFGHVVLAIPNIPTHPRRSPARTQRAMEESWSSAVEFEFAAQILCERKYFYLVNVIYYLCLFEHLSSAA